MMKKAMSLFLALAMVVSMLGNTALGAVDTIIDPPLAEVEAVVEPLAEAEEEVAATALSWDLFDAPTGDDFGVAFKTSIKNGGTVTQKDGYANILKGNNQNNTAESGNYNWLIPKVAPALPNSMFTIEASIRLNAPVDGERGNEFAARVKESGKLYYIFMKYGTDGGIAVQTNYSDLVPVDTTVWHNYGLVINPVDNTYKIYVDGVMVKEHTSAWTYAGEDLLRTGADTKGRCDMDVESLRAGTGDLSALLGEHVLPDANAPRLTTVELSQSAQKENVSATVTATVTGENLVNATAVSVTLVDSDRIPVEPAVTAAGTFTANQASVALTIPAGLDVGTYYVKAEAEGGSIYSAAYTIETSLEAPAFPTFASLGYTIEMDDYKYNPTEEFNFPTIVDTEDHPVTNSMGNYRYYLFYAPHNSPAGNCVMASNSLDGPWVEYENNPVVANVWPKEDGSGENYYRVSHVSSPQVIWNDEAGKYFMYFHGENPTTRYATSDNLIDWTYGGVCVNANEFSKTGAGFNEASYAKVFEHTVPGLDNKYIMLLMITGNGNSMHRNIYWAHSKDGITWTPVKESLLNPDMESEYDYKDNFSGPWFMPWEVNGVTRYFVICHASSGDMYAFEVGESLDKCIQWGLVYTSQGSKDIPGDDDDHKNYPDYARAGAPNFIQSDDGRWHMFYEAGRRLHANIVHAVEVKGGEEGELARAHLEVEKSTLTVGETQPATLLLWDKRDQPVELDTSGLTFTYHTSDPTVLQCADGVLTALAAGTSTAWITATLDGKTATSSKVTVTVKEATVRPKEVIVTNAETPNKTALNLELPAIFKAQGVLETPIDNYYLYFNYTDEVKGAKSIALSTAPAPEGPWTVHNNGTPIITKDSLSLTGGPSAPWPVWDAQSKTMLMYFSVGGGSIQRATSKDGITFVYEQEVLNQTAVGVGNNAYQQSVYLHEIAGKGNKYTMLFTGNGAPKPVGGNSSGKQLFYAWSNDGLAWTVEKKPLLVPTDGDSGNLASPRLLIQGDKTSLSYHNTTGDLLSVPLNPDFSVAGEPAVYYDSVIGAPDNARAADAAFLEADGNTYFYYTASSNKAKTEEAASVLVCRKLAAEGEILFQDDFSDGNADGWTTSGGTWAVADGMYVQSNTSKGATAFAGDTAWDNYAVEVKVTPTAIANGQKLAVMVIGRTDGASKRYIATYNAINKEALSIVCRDSKDTTLASKAFTMETGKTYVIEFAFSGNKISLSVNGNKELEATDDTFTSGKIGLATNNTSVKFDDVVVRRLSGPPLPTAPITLKEFGDHQVIQRDVANENAAVTIAGKVGSPEGTKVEARVMNFADGASDTPVVGWTAIDQSITEGAYSGTLTVPQGGWYRVETRVLNAGDEILGTAVGTLKWGVGINILCIGQSNMVGQGKDKPYTVANDLVANYRSGTWKHLVDPYDGAGGSLVPAMANDLVAKLGIPVGIIPAGNSGSGLHGPNQSTNPPHAANRYWMFYEPTNASTLYGNAIARAKAAGGVELSVWNQGETDGSLLIPEDVYESDMKLLLQRLRTDLGNPKLPMFLCQIGTHNPNISNDAAYTWIRNAQHDLDDEVNFFLAATEMEFARQDTAHYKTTGMNEIGKRVANSILYYYGESTYYRGPAITGADYADDTRKVVDVKITHRGGSDITPSSDIKGFIVLDGLNEASITSAVRQSADTIRLTLSAPISANGSVRYLYGLNPFSDGTPSPASDMKTDAIVVKDNTPLALPLENTTRDIPIGDDVPPVWNLIEHEMGPLWTADGWRTSTKTNNGVPNGAFTQKDDYLNISKPNESNLGDRDLYHWAISPATLALPRDGFTLQVRARTAGDVEAAANEIGVRMGLHKDDPNGKLASFFLGHGENGFVSTTPAGTGPFTMALDTTLWHDFTLVTRLESGAYVFDLYVDKALAFENIPFVTYKGGDLIRMGADNGGRCNLDVQTIRLGSGEVLPEGISPARVTDVSLSAQSQKENEAKTVTVTVTGLAFQDGETVNLTLLDRSYRQVPGVAAQAVFTDNTAIATLTIPAGLAVTSYYVKAVANGRTRNSAAYTIESVRSAPIFPQFTPQGYTIEMEDYKYNPTKEFNFPTIVDTKEHPVTNSMGDYRYYLFYAPHDAPAGNCVAASNSLDGPWVEYENNPVVGKDWEDNYNVSHVSSPQVVWNDVYDCYFMYFHGENPTTRYATSTDLLNWTYGGVCVNANDFSPTGSGFNEASYAKVFEHTVPGLNNKYIMLLMITGSGTGGHRNIYWAHSEDGKEWTAVQTSLLDPTMDSEYRGNFSGPWFMERDGRYFVICHASSGNMYSFEVGESLNECIPWGVFYNSVDSADPNDPDHDDAYPDYGRSGAPSFIKSDDGRWHMFYEGGKRLHANIVHATAPADYTPPVYDNSTTTKTETLPDGTRVTTKTNKRTGTVTITTQTKDGTKTIAETKKDGSLTETLTTPGGTKAQSTVTAQGAATATVTVPDKSGKVTVELPAGNGNVALLVAPDGSTKVIPMSIIKDGRARVVLKDSAQIRFEYREVSFTDVTDATQGEAITALAAQGIFKGTGPTDFLPEIEVDRAMLVTLLHRIDGEQKPEQASAFHDVAENAWYAQAATWASSAGITKGVGGGSFAPQVALSWQQLAAMLYRYADITPTEGEEKSEAELALDWCDKAAIGVGLEPGKTITRGELAAMLYNYMKALVG